MTAQKRAAGRAAADLVTSGQTVGLGTGSTVFFVLERLAERIRDEGLEILGVPTSVDTEIKARDLGIALSTLDEVERFHVTIDGADEIDGGFRMIKGGGGALLREKVVASLSDEVITVVGPDKVVERLGTTFDLPVEVVPFARAACSRRIAGLGGTPALRGGEGPVPHRQRQRDPRRPLRRRYRGPRGPRAGPGRDPGVVESGLFVGLSHVLVIGHDDGSADVRRRGG